MAYRGLGRVEQAQAELERLGSGVIKLGDPAVDALAGLVRGERLLVIQGRRALEAGELRAAADWFAKAVAAAPTSIAARTDLAAVLLQLGEHSAALELVMRVYQEDPAAGHAETVALVLAAMSRCGEALEWIRRAVSVAEQSGDAAEVRRLSSESSKYRNACQ